MAALLTVAVFAGAVAASPGRGTVTTIRAVASAYSSPHWTPKRVKIDPGTRVEWLAVNYEGMCGKVVVHETLARTVRRT